MSCEICKEFNTIQYNKYNYHDCECDGTAKFCPNCGRPLTEPEPSNEYDGLKVKYRVYKARDGELVNNCFVLRPDKDPAAVEALRAYADATDNKQLAQDILVWLKEEA